MRCPMCGAAHHQDPDSEYACWTYGEVCAASASIRRGSMTGVSGRRRRMRCDCNPHVRAFRLAAAGAAAGRRSGCKVLLIGTGHIGSMAFGLLARQPAIAELLLIDPQHYGTENLLTQNIAQDDVGEPKAIALARQAMRIRPRGDLTVRSIVDRVENVPMGLLQCGPDLHRSRFCANRAAGSISSPTRLGGIPWIDAGVRGDEMLARVNVYFPGGDSPCLECAMGPRDYELLSQRYGCDGKLKPAPATNSPALLRRARRRDARHRGTEILRRRNRSHAGRATVGAGGSASSAFSEHAASQQ